MQLLAYRDLVSANWTRAETRARARAGTLRGVGRRDILGTMNLRLG